MMGAMIFPQTVNLHYDFEQKSGLVTNILRGAEGQRGFG